MLRIIDDIMYGLNSIISALLELPLSIKLIMLMLLGIIIGRLFFYNNKTIIKLNYKLLNISLYVLMFSLSIAIASNDKVTKQLSYVGINAIVLSIGGLLGSIFVSYFVHKILFKNKFKR